MIEKVLAICIVLLFIIIACLVITITIDVIAFIEVECSQNIAEWIIEKVFKKKRGGK